MNRGGAIHNLMITFNMKCAVRKLKYFRSRDRNYLNVIIENRNNIEFNENAQDFV